MMALSCLFRVLSYSLSVVEIAGPWKREAFIFHYVEHATDLLGTFCFLCSWLVLVSFWAQQFLIHRQNRTNARLLSTEDHARISNRVNLFFWILVTAMFLVNLAFIAAYVALGLTARDLWFRLVKLALRVVVSACIVLGILYFGIQLWMEHRKLFHHVGSNFSRVCSEITVGLCVVVVVLMMVVVR